MQKFTPNSNVLPINQTFSISNTPSYSPTFSYHHYTLNWHEISYFSFHIWVRVCDICLSGLGLFHSTQQLFYPYLEKKSQDFRFLTNTPTYTCTNITMHIFLSHSSVNGHFNWFHFLGTVNSAIINIRVQLSRWQSNSISLEYLPNSESAGIYGSSIFSFVRKFHIVFHNGGTNLHSHKEYEKISSILPSLVTVSFCPFYNNQWSWRWYFIILPICTEIYF